MGSVVKQCLASPVLGWVTIQGKAGALGVMVVVALGFQVCHYHHAGSLKVHSAPPQKLRRCSGTAPKKFAVWESRPGCLHSPPHPNSLQYGNLALHGCLHSPPHPNSLQYGNLALGVSTPLPTRIVCSMGISPWVSSLPSPPHPNSLQYGNIALGVSTPLPTRIVYSTGISPWVSG